MMIFLGGEGGGGGGGGGLFPLTHTYIAFSVAERRWCGRKPFDVFLLRKLCFQTNPSKYHYCVGNNNNENSRLNVVNGIT